MYKRQHLAFPELSGTLHFSDLHPLPKRWYAPGIMGPFAFLPFMECYHGIVSMSHRVTGRLQADGREVLFEQGRGYTEKDWGRSFPQAWVWLQSNHLSGDATGSLSASVAHIPYLGLAFTGFIVAFLWQQHLYTFTTYNGGKLDFLRIDQHTVSMAFSRPSHLSLIHI